MSTRRGDEDIERRLKSVADQVGREWSTPFRSEVVTAIQDALLLIERLKQENAALKVLLMKR